MPVENNLLALHILALKSLSFPLISSRVLVTTYMLLNFRNPTILIDTEGRNPLGGSVTKISSLFPNAVSIFNKKFEVVTTTRSYIFVENFEVHGFHKLTPLSFIL